MNYIFYSGSEYKDGERLQLSVKDLGSCEIYPQTLKHNANGRLKHLIIQLLLQKKSSFID